jgi:hypothetical protein
MRNLRLRHLRNQANNFYAANLPVAKTFWSCEVYNELAN